MSLSFSDGGINSIPIAKIKDSKKIIYLDPDNNTFEPIPTKNIKAKTFKCPYCGKIIKTKENFIYHLNHDNTCKKKKESKKKNTNVTHIETEIKINPKTDTIVREEFEILPSADIHECLYIIGPPNSGKNVFY